MSGPTCIYCKHCTVQQVRGDAQLVCTVDRSKHDAVVVVEVYGTCRRFRPDAFADFMSWPMTSEV